MKSVLRESLLEQLQKVSSLADLYATADPVYVDKVIQWLMTLEELLQKHRHTAQSMVAAERTRIISVRDGATEPDKVDPKTPKRKAIRVIASSSVMHVESILRAHVEMIDHEFSDMQGKISQLLALASNRAPIPFPPTSPHEAWLIKVWNGLAGGDTQSMYDFMNASLPRVDRLYLLDELLDNLMSSIADSENTQGSANTSHH